MSIEFVLLRIHDMFQLSGNCEGSSDVPTGQNRIWSADVRSGSTYQNRPTCSVNQRMLFDVPQERGLSIGQLFGEC